MEKIGEIIYDTHLLLFYGWFSVRVLKMHLVLDTCIDVFTKVANGRASRPGRSNFESGPWYACFRTVGMVPLWYVKGFDAPLSVTGGSINLARAFTPRPGRWERARTSFSQAKTLHGMSYPKPTLKPTLKPVPKPAHNHPLYEVNFALSRMAESHFSLVQSFPLQKMLYMGRPAEGAPSLHHNQLRPLD